MTNPAEDLAGSLAALLQHTSASLGFTRPYRFTLWLVLCGSLTGFILLRLRYLDIDGHFCSASRVAVPGECYYLGRGLGKAGLAVHLATIFPAGLLAVVQFTPAARRRYPGLHRRVGYLVVALAAVSCAGVLAMARWHFGGGLVPQTVTGAAVVMFLASLGFAVYYIRRLRIDRHRAWMLRAWAVATHVLSMRLIAMLMVAFTRSPSNHYYDYRPCAVIDYIFKHDAQLVASMYPDCADYYSGAAPERRVLISADVASGRPDQVAAGLNATFGAAAWLALLVHCVAVEAYLQLTPGESERLRRLSAKRQAEAGMAEDGVDCACAAAVVAVECGDLDGVSGGWKCRGYEKMGLAAGGGEALAG